MGIKLDYEAFLLAHRLPKSYIDMHKMVHPDIEQNTNAQGYAKHTLLVSMVLKALVKVH